MKFEKKKKDKVYNIFAGITGIWDRGDYLEIVMPGIKFNPIGTYPYAACTYVYQFSLRNFSLLPAIDIPINDVTIKGKPTQDGTVYLAWKEKSGEIQNLNIYLHPVYNQKFVKQFAEKIQEMIIYRMYIDFEEIRTTILNHFMMKRLQEC